jgi:hypothetical protein
MHAKQFYCNLVISILNLCVGVSGTNNSLEKSKKFYRKCSRENETLFVYNYNFIN